MKEWLEVDGNWFSIQYMWGNSQFVEAKNLHWTLSADVLGQADGLNNIEWRGTAEFKCDASRTCPIDGGPWTQWVEGFGKLDTDHVWNMGISPYVIVKQAGEWTIQHKNNTARWTKPESEHPPGRSKPNESGPSDANRPKRSDTARVNPERSSPEQSNRWNMVVGAWYGVLYWPDGTINKQEVIFNSDLTQVRTRASNRSAASNWGNYAIHRNENSLSWEVPGPGRTTVFTLVPDQNAQRAKGACQIIQQGTVTHSATGEFGRVDVPLL